MYTELHSSVLCSEEIEPMEPSFYDNGVPVFKPSISQFQDFYLFNKAIDKYGLQAGIVRIIPPKEWSEKLSNCCYTKENLAKVSIRNPIVQRINHDGHGVFQSQNVERPRKYSLEQWKELSKSYQPPKKRKRRQSNEKGAEEKSCVPEYNIDTSIYTDEKCKDLERAYWKSLTYAEPIYGADTLGSLFTEDIKSWNVAKLPNILDLMEEEIPGVNNAYLYAGTWKATFAWHLEDQDLYSINYLHFGAPKQWYSIPQSENKKFFSLMKDLFADEYKNCSQFLRHKTFIASPQFLAKKGITVNHTIHREGEFIITYPYGYHAGFNYDYNLAESVNFALDTWFEFAKSTEKCKCISDAVDINVGQLWKKFKSTQSQAIKS
ncbi:hypothetical protein KGF56_002568 [Candida oxycetoniae]|uniref:Uncharacterized protein n=1 Tax=Candida oxycetoniae TaxID=497107 RepID=A0AAI9SX69_9ASCO|nr:uncharacterized protein KGF56_002568 [Candida oxycetoniae]KAI3404623.2 hypothetical protein KGF56_002568 [Candida oxycetoniae]